MRIRLPLKAIVALVLIFAVSVSVTTAYFLRNKFAGLNISTAEKITEINQLLKENYYFELDNDKMNDALITGYVDGLEDNYSAYYNLDTSSQQLDTLKGNSHGIGIIAVESPDSGEIFVWKVYRDSPAALAGIKAGDYITAVGGKEVKKLGFNQAIKKIQGSIGKKTKITVSRDNKEFTKEVQCADTDMQSVYSYMAKGTTIGVVQIIDFNQKTYPQFKAEIDSLINEGATALVFDLRHNSGGTVEAAANMLDYLLPSCDTVHVKYKDGNVEVRNTSDKECIELPFAILTDKYTASSSEIFVSVMKQQGKAVVIGSKTFGKSLIQRSFTLKDGSRVKFTIGEFVPQSGESYNEIGIEPDITVDAGYTASYDYYFLTQATDKVLKAAVNELTQLS